MLPLVPPCHIHRASTTIPIWRYLVRSAFTLTRGGGDSGEGHVANVPLSADGGPGRLGQGVVLHHQREGVPGEISAQVMAAHNHPAAAPQAGGNGRNRHRFTFDSTTIHLKHLCQLNNCREHIAKKKMPGNRKNLRLIRV